MMYGFNSGWYVIYTRPQQERKVVQHLSEKQLNHYLPTIEKVRQWHDRKKVIKVPLFPSYVFVHLSRQKDYYDSINDNPGFLYFVKSGKTNARISEEVIHNIRFVLDNGKEIETTSGYIEPGTQMIIRNGPFTGLVCQVVEHKKTQKILVKLDMLNRSILATIPAECLY